MNNKHYVGRRISDFKLYDEVGPITGIALILDDEGNEVFAGDDTGYTLEVSCPYGTEAIANDLLAKLGGKTYKGFHGENAVIDPAAELGDGVSVNGTYSMIAHKEVVFGPGHMAEISAPGDNELQHEFEWTSPKDRAFNRKIANTRSLITKNAEEIRLEIQGVEEEISYIALDIDSITSRVQDAEGNIGELELTATELRSEISGKIDGEYAQTLIDQNLEGIELSVSSANGSTTFTLKAGEAELCTETLNLTVNAVNVKGELTASQIKAGAITVSKLSEGVKEDISSAKTAASAASSAVNAITYTYDGETYIDEDCIMAGTVIAGDLMGGSVRLLDADENVQGYLTITDADTADYAVEIQSNGAMRLLADGDWAALWLEAGGDSGDGYLALRTVTVSGEGYGYHVVVNRPIIPASDGSCYVGTSYRVFAGMYTETDPVVTSDRNKKKDITYDLSSMDGFFDGLKPSMYRLKNGTSGRKHPGFVAQDIKDNLDKHGIPTTDFAGYVEDVDENGEKTYGIRYGEFIALLVEQVQKLKARVAELEGNHGKKH